MGGCDIQTLPPLQNVLVQPVKSLCIACSSSFVCLDIWLRFFFTTNFFFFLQSLECCLLLSMLCSDSSSLLEESLQPLELDFFFFTMTAVAGRRFQGDERQARRSSRRGAGEMRSAENERTIVSMLRYVCVCECLLRLFSDGDLKCLVLF